MVSLVYSTLVAQLHQLALRHEIRQNTQDNQQGVLVVFSWSRVLAVSQVGRGW
jgi:hypothetical protein